MPTELSVTPITVLYVLSAALIPLAVLFLSLRKKQQRLSALGTLLGLEVRSGRNLVGRVEGRQVQLTPASGQRGWWSISVSCSPRALPRTDLHHRRSALLSPADRLTHGPTFQLGVADIDDAFVLRSQEASVSTQLFSAPAVVQALAKFAAANGFVKNVQLARMGLFEPEGGILLAGLRQHEGMGADEWTRLLCILAEALERR